ncbi:hypothetical protein [Spirosoma sp. KUDC1026]|uniref:hypothetical protein n=1 Tax=Spirosoma sp. KUDC1026 TaxID=2745947 RepID=UPI00159B862E|nr:hypothetical protein [Spirosoma sp. KUDC1026]QKZ13346.1 hypothetical protein HU175_12160 [Spirosoma sp. KUDC1026]
MSRLFLQLIAILLLCVNITHAQYKYRYYKDFVQVDNTIWALTTEGTVKIISLTNRKTLRTIINDQAITYITKDRKGTVMLLDRSNQIKTYNEDTGSWKTRQTIEQKLFALAFDSQNNGYAITDKGILNLKTRELHFSKIPQKYFLFPEDSWDRVTCSYVDKDDIIWVGFYLGEWGGGKLLLFNTDTKTFSEPILHKDTKVLPPVQSLFGDSTTVYASVSWSNGSVIHFQDFRATVLFESKNHWGKPFGKYKIQESIEGEHIGPATLSRYDNSIYFGSQNGIFRGNRSKDLANVKNWKKIVSPTSNWFIGQPISFDSPMNVAKIVATGKGKFVFLSRLNGIGFFDNGRLTMIK